jgi:hypothetical protein
MESVMNNSIKSVSVEQQDSNWTVTVSENGITQRFDCHSRRMAERFASLFESANETMAMAA